MVYDLILNKFTHLNDQSYKNFNYPIPHKCIKYFMLKLKIVNNFRHSKNDCFSVNGDKTNESAVTKK